MTNENNIITATGMLGALHHDHTIMGEDFFIGTLYVKRLSGAVDEIPVTVPGKLLVMPGAYAFPVMVSGQVRSYNKIIDGVSRLAITLFAQHIDPALGDETQNSVSLIGTICKRPVYRVTPFGREICDLTLAVNRGFGKSDYIPCIVWGRNGEWASRLSVGQHVAVKGRLQSRQYIKVLEDGTAQNRTAYELSVFTIDRVQEEEMVRA